MPLNLNQLRVFYHVAKHLSFTRAAKELHITQPAVTAQIKAFEEHCGFMLFMKVGRKVHLTSEGAALFEYAKRLFEFEIQIENSIEEMRELKQGVLRVGSARTYARYLMPYLISNYHRQYGAIKIQLSEGPSIEVVQGLLDGRLDMAIIAKVNEPPEVVYIPFSREELVLIASPNHPLAKRKSISLGEVAEQILILKERGSGTNTRVIETFDQYGLTPNILMETNNSELIKQLVARREGLSFLSNAAVIDDIRQGKLVKLKIKESPIYLDVNIAHLVDTPLPPAARAFVDVLINLIRDESSLPTIEALKKKIHIGDSEKTD